ncbi:MAG: HEPN domain-containing protein [Pseudomonadota bacterium]
MTEENKRENIKAELEEAAKTLLEADLLFKNSFFKGAFSRLYYALLYSIRAVLLTKGLEPKSHEGALRLFSLHFVKENVFKAKAAHVFSKMMKYREEADYNPAYIFSKEDYIELRKEVVELSDEIIAYLKEKDYL